MMGTKENVASAEKASIRTYFSMADSEKKGCYCGASRFVYDAGQDLYSLLTLLGKGEPEPCYLLTRLTLRLLGLRVTSDRARWTGASHPGP